MFELFRETKQLPVAIPFRPAHHARMANEWEREVARFFHSNRARNKQSAERKYGADKVAQAILARIERDKKGK